MKNAEREELDEYFKTGLTSPEVSEVDEDWVRMKAILLKNKRSRKLLNSLFAVMYVAATLLLVFILFPGTDEIAGDNTYSSGPIADKENTLPLVLDKTPAAPPEVPTSNVQQSRQLSIQSPVPFKANEAAYQEFMSTGEDTGHPAAGGLINTEVDDLIAETVVLPAKPFVNRDTMSVSPLSGEDHKIRLLSGSRFSLAFVLSPDFSGVDNLRKAGVGYGIGAGIIYRLSDKVDIETGISYGVKVYNTDFSNYKPNSNYVFPEKPYAVDANCEVIDFHIDMTYHLMHRDKFNLGIRAGISSYTMLQENYRFIYENNYQRGPRRYDLESQNKHFPGVANLSLSYQRKLSDQVKIAFDPYIKLPLTDIGYGNVRLRSAGINIGIITNLTNHQK
jgi:hypothetical protein